jgi:hypothetical protein
MKGKMAPSTMPTLVQASRQNVDTPWMSSPQERQMRKQRQKIKRESDTMFPKVEEHPLTEGNIYQDWMDNNESQHNLQQQQ